MAFPTDLLELARDIAKLREDSTHQASLRRAVSTTYYALFHLLISEATANWARPELRAILGRSFDHGPMKTASESKIAQINTRLKSTQSGQDSIVDIHLRTVADAFVQAQKRRIEADYNIAKDWTPVEVETQIALVADAFKAWESIRDEAVAQAYLVSLLGTKERRPNEPKPPTSAPENRKKRSSPRPTSGGWRRAPPT